MKVYFGAARTENGGLRSNYSYGRSFFSIEPEFGQAHGCIVATKFTREISFGIGWTPKTGDRDLHCPRFWITGIRAKHERPINRAAWHVYWNRYTGLRATNYLGDFYG